MLSVKKHYNIRKIGENMSLSSWLIGFKIALIATTGVEQIELEGPKRSLEEAGAIVSIVSPEDGRIRGWDCYTLLPRDEFIVDVPLKNASAEDFDALVIPGGMFIDDIRLADNALPFISGFKNKPIASICHGQQLLVNSGFLKGKTVTSYPGIEIDLINAGSHWVDQEVVRDGLLLTGRKRADTDAFDKALIEFLKEYKDKSLKS